MIMLYLTHQKMPQAVTELINERLFLTTIVQAALAQCRAGCKTNLLDFPHHEKVQQVAGQVEDLSTVDIPWWHNVI